MRISDWSSDMCSSDLGWRRDHRGERAGEVLQQPAVFAHQAVPQPDFASLDSAPAKREGCSIHAALSPTRPVIPAKRAPSNSDCHPGQATAWSASREPWMGQTPSGAMGPGPRSLTLACPRSEEHTSELQSLMRISYAVFCLKKKT